MNISSGGKIESSQGRYPAERSFPFKKPSNTRHPSEYLIIVNKAAALDKTTLLPVGMQRLSPNDEIPQGHIAVKSVRGLSPYKEDGILRGAFKALERYSAEV